MGGNGKVTHSVLLAVGRTPGERNSERHCPSSSADGLGPSSHVWLAVGELAVRSRYCDDGGSRLARNNPQNFLATARLQI
jgi:hypothetical protein